MTQHYFLRREGHFDAPEVPGFAPLVQFTTTAQIEKVVFAHIDWRLLQCWRGIMYDVPARRLCVDTIRKSPGGPSLVGQLGLHQPGHRVHPAHIYGLLLKQPRGERHDESRLLLAKKEIGNVFVHRIHNGIPMAIRLRYYDKMKVGETIDEMGHGKSGWVVDEVSTESADFAQAGGRIGYYERV